MSSPDTTVLVVEDEDSYLDALNVGLTVEGFSVVGAGTIAQARELMASTKPDLVLLDVNMPGMGGIEACREIRRGSSAPIIMLTVRNAERDKVLALDAGADDYVVKPFGIEELLARIRASLRRHAQGENLEPFHSKELSVDFERRQVLVRGAAVHLAPKEYEVLKLLVMNQGKPLTHRRLLQSVWGPDYGEETENLRVVINQLRKKIEPDPAKPKLLLTEPWVGYRFAAPRTAATKSGGRKSVVS